MRQFGLRPGGARTHGLGCGLAAPNSVKTRRGDGYGTAAAAVTPAKQARLRALAAAYLAATPHPACRVRFDVVTVSWPRGGQPVIDHLEGVF